MEPADIGVDRSPDRLPSSDPSALSNQLHCLIPLSASPERHSTVLTFLGKSRTQLRDEILRCNGRGANRAIVAEANIVPTGSMAEVYSDDFLLKQQGITHVVVTGLLANTCIESTARFAMELGYHVTLVRDATAAFSKEMMRAAHDLNGPTFAHAITTTAELLAAFPA